MSKPKPSKPRPQSPEARIAELEREIVILKRRIVDLEGKSWPAPTKLPFVPQDEEPSYPEIPNPWYPAPPRTPYPDPQPIPRRPYYGDGLPPMYCGPSRSP